MEIIRKPFQGVRNIILFNWPFYATAAVLLLLLFTLQTLLPEGLRVAIVISGALILYALVASLVASHLIYDRSTLYELRWLRRKAPHAILNLSAGFDEISELIRHQQPDCTLTNCDFFSPERHTEKSIQRARKAYPPPADLMQVSPHQLPFGNGAFDTIIAFLAAHEIRKEDERIAFFQELRRVLKDEGEIAVTEHLRDVNNLMVYTIGFLHFHSRRTWLRTFKKAGLEVVREAHTTPFVTTFILKKNGNSPAHHRNNAHGARNRSRHLS